MGKYKNTLSKLPSAWADVIDIALCRLSSTEVDTCGLERECQTITSLSDYVQDGSVVRITFVDENGTSVIRELNLELIVGYLFDDIDSTCIGISKTDWLNMSFKERIEALMTDVSTCCVDATSTSTTTSSTTTTTTINDDPFDYYLAVNRLCEDCGTEVDNVIVKFPTGTSVTIGNHYILNPFDGNVYEILGPTASGGAIDLTNSTDDSTCTLACPTTTTTSSSTTTTTTASPTFRITSTLPGTSVTNVNNVPGYTLSQTIEAGEEDTGFHDAFTGAIQVIISGPPIFDGNITLNVNTVDIQCIDLSSIAGYPQSINFNLASYDGSDVIELFVNIGACP